MTRSDALPNTLLVTLRKNHVLMTRQIAIGRLLAATLCLLLTATAPVYATGPLGHANPADIHQGVPPNNLRGGQGDSLWRTDLDIKGRMRIDCVEKKLLITWRYNYIVEEQELALPYYPTTAIRKVHADPGKDMLCVAGKLEDGTTVVELITLQQPRFLLSYPTGTVYIRNQSVSTRRYIYHDSVEGRDMIRLIRSMSHNPELLLLKFEDSGALYTVDINTRSISAEASVDGVDGSLSIPLLANFYGGMWTGNHNTLGDVYVLVPSLEILSGATPIVLIDSDTDGDIDSYLTPNQAEWDTHGLSNANNFTDW